MGNKLWLAAAAVSLSFLGACATMDNGADPGNSSRKFKAHSIIFHRAPQPLVTSKVFLTNVESLTRSNLRSFQFNNYINNTNKPDVVVTLAISGARAGLAIYDNAGMPMLQIPNGQAMQNLVEFESKTDEGSTKIRWYLGANKILSIFEAYDANGVLGYSENTIYLAD